MSTVPTKPTLAALPEETVETHFRRLETTWMSEVGHHSSTTKLVNHPAFQEIIRMGPAVVPFMLRDLEERPRLWVWALPDITGANPVPTSDAGSIARMSEAWLRWARTRLRMVTHLEDLFPGLRGSEYEVTSQPNDRYNCIAWAAGSIHNNLWWWPFGDPEKTWWPEGVPRAETLEAFRQLFATLGYAECARADMEPGYQKVALIADEQGFPLHAARQLSSGRWTSKLGALDDIEHALEDLVGTEYGAVVLVLKRPLPNLEA